MKGISPLIAAVLLIAFTVGIAGIAGPYLTQVMQQSTQGQQEEADRLLDASSASISVVRADYNSFNEKLRTTIQNEGQQTLENYTVTAFGNDSAQETVDEQLDAREITTVKINLSSPPEEVRVQSQNLPVSETAVGDKIEITGTDTKILVDSSLKPLYTQGGTSVNVGWGSSSKTIYTFSDGDNYLTSAEYSTFGISEIYAMNITVPSYNYIEVLPSGEQRTEGPDGLVNLRGSERFRIHDFDSQISRVKFYYPS